jgi:spermidine synthase
MAKRVKKNNWLFESPDVPFDTSETESVLKIKKKIYSGRSPYQKIEVFDTFSFGRILVLDGIFQTSEKDEFIYHEMLCHLPMFYCPNPKKVLIIGGGDGGALEEVLKHPVEKVWMVEIDKKVIEVSKKYLPSISRGAFNSKKVEIIIGDGLEFIKKFKNFFDVIILDLSDPWGPARQLISLKFYNDVKKALREKGVIAVQSGSITTQPKLVSTIYKRLKKIFPSVEVHRASVPLYGIGEYSFTLASRLNLKRINLVDLKRKFNKLRLKTNYYLPEIHLSSRTQPKFLRKLLRSSR